MLMVLIDAAVLIVALKMVSDEDLGFGAAIIIALIASIGTAALAYGLASAMGVFGLILAGVIAAAALGAAVSLQFGVEIKRSFLVGFIFMVVHVGASLALSAMFS